jgi:hypothetical protein
MLKMSNNISGLDGVDSLLDGAETLDVATLTELLRQLTAVHNDTVSKQQTVLSRLKMLLEAKKGP